MECPEAAEAIGDGDEVIADMEKGVITDKTTVKTFETKPFPAFIGKIIADGGLVESIKKGSIR